MANEVITITGIFEFFKDDLNSISKGELKYKADYVMDFRIYEYKINAKIRASMKDKCYPVSLIVDGDGGIVEGQCDCPRGNWICSHMAATALYANKKGVSKTDLPNSWIAKPKKAAKLDSKTFADLFPNLRPQYRATSREFTPADRDVLHRKLAKLSVEGTQCPMQWITGPEPLNQSANLTGPIFIEELIEDFIKDKESFIRKARATEEQIVWLSNRTIGQRRTSLWGQYRKMRLTGSNFGDVINAMERRENKKIPIPPSLLKKLRGEYSINTRDAVIWGQMHEKIALETYEKETGNKVQECGLSLFPCGFLGSSPDGIIFIKRFAEEESKGVLEIKCPWSHRNSRVTDMIDAELKGKDKKSFFLTTTGELNRNHPYWHQVLGEIAATGVSWAHFVVWTTIDMQIINVERDPL